VVYFESIELMFLLARIEVFKLNHKIMFRFIFFILVESLIDNDEE